MEGTVLIERKDANRDFYGSPISARDILGGKVPPPEVASQLYEIIEAAEGLDETGLPERAYVPTPTGEQTLAPAQPAASAGYNVGGDSTVFDVDHHP